MPGLRVLCPFPSCVATAFVFVVSVVVVSFFFASLIFYFYPLSFILYPFPIPYTLYPIPCGLCPTSLTLQGHARKIGNRVPALGVSSLPFSLTLSRRSASMEK